MEAQLWPPGCVLDSPPMGHFSFAARTDGLRGRRSRRLCADSFEQLAALYRELLGQESLEQLLEHAADAVADLVPCSSLVIAEFDADEREIVPVLARGTWAEQILGLRPRIGEGLIGWAVEQAQPVLSNEAHQDPRAGHIAGTPVGEPEAVACLPLIARGQVLGALSLYREGAEAGFSQQEFELAGRFADAVTLALANAKARVELEKLARSDELTGCLNRRGLSHHFGALNAAATAAHEQTALLLIDLDQFKQVNDRFGHATGDLLLKHIAHQLRACAPEEACVARLGGDEFAILFTAANERAAPAAARAVAAAIRNSSFLTRNGSISIGASIGMAAAAPATATLTSLLEQADATMYNNKDTARSPASTDGRIRRRAS
jgi:diguanylate cyclase (GGDEF)-like protein